MREVEDKNKQSLEKIKQKLKEVIKIELTQMASQHSFPIKAYIQVLGARVNTKKNYVEIAVNLSRKKMLLMSYLLWDCTFIMIILPALWP